MKELNELVGQAKFVADWHGSDWSSALCQDKDGKQSHEIICESRSESVISTGSNSNEASWLCDYLELCSPANILAIAEAFMALEQRAEAAEAKLAENEKSSVFWGRAAASETIRANIAEKKLAELERQEPAEYQSYYHNHGTGAGQWLPVTSKQAYERMKVKYAGDNDFSFRELFTRPAPAINLAELVPQEMSPIKASRSYGGQVVGYHDGWNACRAAMLRNIEEKSK